MYSIYLVERTGLVEWDEYDSCVVVAENEEDAIMVAMQDYGKHFADHGVIATKVKLDERKSVLGSFNAG